MLTKFTHSLLSQEISLFYPVSMSKMKLITAA